MGRGARGEAIIRGRRLFYVFPSKGGDYSRNAFNRGTATIRGNAVYKEARYIETVRNIS